MALRRQLLRGGPPSSRKSRTGGGSGGGGGDGDTAAPPAAARAPGVGVESKWDEDGDMIEPDPATIAAAAAASAAAATAESIARWNQQQKQEQEQRLRELIAKMRETVDEGDDVGSRRPTLRRGSSSVDSRGSSSRFSISGSGTSCAIWLPLQSVVGTLQLPNCVRNAKVIFGGRLFRCIACFPPPGT